MSGASFDRVLEPSFSADLADLDLAEVKRRRAGAKEAEQELSLVRRLLHAELDLLKDELERRQNEGSSEHRTELVDRLGQVLTGEGAGTSRGARAPLPDGGGLSEETEALLGRGDLARLPEMDADEISALVDNLVANERRVSERRRQVFGVLDALEEELVRRYKAEPGAAIATLFRPNRD